MRDNHIPHIVLPLLYIQKISHKDHGVDKEHKEEGKKDFLSVIFS
jgi:hypothetical protein